MTDQKDRGTYLRNQVGIIDEKRHKKSPVANTEKIFEYDHA
jgi:hypothetical protein